MDRPVALVSVIIAIIYLLAAWRLPAVQIGDPLGPKLFPILLGAGLLFCSVLLLLESRGRLAEGRSWKPWPYGFRTGLFPVVTTMLGLLVYTLLYEILGFLLDTTLFLLIALICLNHKQWKVNILVSIGFSAIVYALFAKFLGVALPKGLIPL